MIGRPDVVEPAAGKEQNCWFLGSCKGSAGKKWPLEKWVLHVLWWRPRPFQRSLQRRRLDHTLSSSWLMASARDRVQHYHPAPVRLHPVSTIYTHTHTHTPFICTSPPDFGWNDVGYHYKNSGGPANDIQTPHIDSLVEEGVELDRHCRFFFALILMCYYFYI